MRDKRRHKTVVGDTVCLDTWSFPEVLKRDDGYKDSSFPGCQFRVDMNGTDVSLAVNVTVTGGPHWASWSDTTYKSRCKVEFVGDGEPSTFAGGWIYHKGV